MLQRLDHPLRCVQHAGHFPVAQPLEVLQDNHGPLLGRQLHQRSAGQLPGHGLLHFPLYVLASGSRPVIQWLVIPVHLAPGGIDHKIVGHPVQPSL
jgi:hypothetical protein